METTDQKINKVVNELKGGFYGIAEIVDNFENETYYLIHTEIADPTEDWECAEYYLLKRDLSESYYLAHCDGYNGVKMQLGQSDIDNLLGDNNVNEYLSPFEITGDLLAEAMLSIQEEADEDYEGECKIWAEYCYSTTTLNRPTDGFLTGEDYEDLIFGTYQDALDWINDNTTETYYLSHGEMGAPSYKIFKA